MKSASYIKYISCEETHREGGDKQTIRSAWVGLFSLRVSDLSVSAFHFPSETFHALSWLLASFRASPRHPRLARKSFCYFGPHSRLLCETSICLGRAPGAPPGAA